MVVVASRMVTTNDAVKVMRRARKGFDVEAVWKKTGPRAASI
jgi:hypothetical protein